MPERKNAHLNIDDREYIEEALKRNESFRCIARHLGVSPTTISNEVKNNRIFTKQRKRDLSSYLCRNFKECRKRELCGEMDCVEGRRIDSKAILSLHFKRFELQLYVLLEEQTRDASSPPSMRWRPTARAGSRTSSV